MSGVTQAPESASRVEAEIPAWDQQADEPDVAFARFCVYRDLGPRRAMPQVIAAGGHKPGYLRVLETYSSRYRWLTRVSAWDRHLDKMKQIAAIAAVEEMGIRQAKLAARMQELANLKIESTFRKTNASITVNMETGTFEVPGMTLADVAAFVKIGADLERLSRGAHTQSLEVRVQEAVMLPKSLTPEEFLEVVKNAREAGTLPGGGG